MIEALPSCMLRPSITCGDFHTCGKLLIRFSSLSLGKLRGMRALIEFRQFLFHCREEAHVRVRQEERGHVMVHEIRTFRKLHVGHEPADYGALPEALVVDETDLGAQERGIAQVIELIAVDVGQNAYAYGLLQVNVVAEIAGQDHPVKVIEGHAN
jgi:hypothetical protein